MDTNQINEIIARVTEQVCARLGMEGAPEAGSSMRPQDLAKYIDHTLLKSDASLEEIKKVCDEAKMYKFASVCVNPSYTKYMAEQLAGSGVTPCCVIGFPFGTQTPEAKKCEAEDAVKNGAKELDMVINTGAIKSDDWQLVKRDIEGVVQAARGKAGVKVILETCLLTDEEIVKACTVSKLAGADFVKTSTGYSTGGATEHHVELMRTVVGQNMGVKASGGIRTYEDAVKMIKAGANRLGASAGIKIIAGPSAGESSGCSHCGACQATCPTGSCTITKNSY